MNRQLPMPLDACEKCISHMLKDKKTTIAEIAFPYSMTIIAHEDFGDIKSINRAIINRWSMTALEKIKKQAWAILKSRDTVQQFRADLE